MLIIPWKTATKPIQLLSQAFHWGTFHVVSNRWQCSFLGLIQGQRRKSVHPTSWSLSKSWDGSWESLCWAKRGLTFSFLTQVMFHADSLEGWAGVSWGCPAAWSRGMSSAQPCSSPVWRLYALISMAVNSGKWRIGGKSAVWHWRLQSWYCHSDTAVLILPHFWMLC